MRYRQLQIFIFLFLGLYFAGGLVTRLIPLEEKRSLMPFYSWFLFYKVPNERIAFAVKINEFNGVALDKPILFSEAEGLVREPRSQKAYELIQAWGSKAVAGEEYGEYRRIFEKGYLGDDFVYELVAVKFNPVERVKSGQLEVVRGLGQFRTSGE